MTKDEALRLAQEVMQNQGDVNVDEWIATEKAIKEALAQPEQEPQKQDWKTPPKDDAPLVKWAKEQTPPQPEQESVAMADYMNLMEKYVALLSAQPEQEPVAWVGEISEEAELMLEKPKFQAVPLYTTPPQRTWVGLTKKEVHDLFHPDFEIFHQRIEAKLKEKNT